MHLGAIQSHLGVVQTHLRIAQTRLGVAQLRVWVVQTGLVSAGARLGATGPGAQINARSRLSERTNVLIALRACDLGACSARIFCKIVGETGGGGVLSCNRLGLRARTRAYTSRM